MTIFKPRRWKSIPRLPAPTARTARRQEPFVTSRGTTGGSGSAGAGNQHVEIDIGATVFKVLHDGTV